jgi:dCTP deaminase
MSVLSSNEIKRRLNIPGTEPGSLVITPLLNLESALDNDAFDLRLGSQFLIPQVPPQPFVDPSAPARAHLRLHIPFGGYLVVPAHQTVLGATLEFVKLPFDVSGQILTKSSVARLFVVIETAPWIHPLYRGCLTLEIANVSNTPLLLYPGRQIAQLILLSVENPEKPRLLQGSFIGPVFPEAPPPADVAKDLRSIGVRSPQHPCDDFGARSSSK